MGVDMRTSHIGFYIEPELAKRLHAAARLRGVSVSTFVAELVKRELDGEVSSQLQLLFERISFTATGLDALLKHTDPTLRQIVRRTHEARMKGAAADRQEGGAS